MAHKTPSKTEKHNPMQLYPHIVNTGTIGTSCPVIGRPVMHCPALALHRVPPRPKALRPIPCAKCPAPRRELPCTPARAALHPGADYPACAAARYSVSEKPLTTHPSKKSPPPKLSKLTRRFRRNLGRPTLQTPRGPSQGPAGGRGGPLERRQ